MATWVLYELVERPFYDPEGKVLRDISKRGNRPGIDAFSGGGYVYPELGKAKILERYESEGEWLVLLEGDSVPPQPSGRVEAFTFREVKGGRKEARVELLGSNAFRERTVSEEEALATGMIVKDDETTEIKP